MTPPSLHGRALARWALKPRSDQDRHLSEADAQQVRLSRLLAALAAGDPASVDAVLSIRTAASMAGARELAESYVDVLTSAFPRPLEHGEARLGTMVAVHDITPPALLEL